ncbi:CFI-box-CTERM domain-containing protein [[Eubacterium] cellulosolvens]
MFSLLLITYAPLDNIDVYGTPPRRPDSPDTGVTGEQPEKPVEQGSTISDMNTKVGQGTAVGVLSTLIGIASARKNRERARQHEEEDIPGGFEGRKKRVKKAKENAEDYGTCCIASSVTGTCMMTQVNFLRNYREKVVKKSARGQRSLNIAEKIYYSISPPIAKLDAKYEKFRLITRTFWSGPIVSLLLCGMLLFDSGRKEFIRLQKADSKLTLKILTMGISSSIFAISWIIWNFYLVISLIYSRTLADIWQPATGMLIGIVSLLILRYFYRDLPLLSDDTKLI